ncbi:MAG: 4Fe-4S dicluster domain-containing protein [Bacteroidales bacterium]|nr:4Fe-4S dicluster domain-containing protein [Bacteroidales bacterium]MCR5193306.1 4Fe-4S dicluster domain-containing protein [Bacteroidales bacterium]
MNCGVCTAVCPAAEFYDYDPRRICDSVQRGDEAEIENLLKSDTIWYCGQCMSCKTRCPRGNVPGELINVLRRASQELGYFTESEKGVQQKQLMNTIGKNILDIGYCVHPDVVKPDYHPEQGPIWEWYIENIEDISQKLGANYHGEGAGALRKISEEDLDEVRRIFEVTGGMELRKKVLDA